MIWYLRSVAMEAIMGNLEIRCPTVSTDFKMGYISIDGRSDPDADEAFFRDVVARMK